MDLLKSWANFKRIKKKDHRNRLRNHF